MSTANLNGTPEPKNMSQSFDKHFENEEPTPPVETKPEEPVENKSPEFLQFIRERDALQASLKQKELELYSSQGRNYELLKKIDLLEAQVKDIKKGGSKPSTPKGGSPALPRKSISVPKTESPLIQQKSPSPAKKKPAKSAHHKRTKKGGKKTDGTGENDASVNQIHPPIPGKEELSSDTQAYYTEIGNLFPLLRLSIFMAIEKRFLECDVNGDGTIDAEELESILTNNVVMYTRSECVKILKELDKDDNESLDFLEVVRIVDLICQNKKTNLPMHLTTEASKSTICSIQ